MRRSPRPLTPLLLVLVAACTIPTTPSAPATLTSPPEELATAAATETPPEPTVEPSATPPPATETPASTPEIATPLPTASAAILPSVTPVTEQPGTPSSTPSPTQPPTPSGPPLDPNSTWGSPKLSDAMRPGTEINWAGEDGEMPDTDNIRLVLEDDHLLVTGKKWGFDTWWFSWPDVSDFYLEMTVKTETCKGSDAYGFVVRGPLRGAKPTRGYIVAFSCDGKYLLRRVDGTDPYQSIDLIPWTASSLIHSGSKQTNIIGIEADGGALSVYANRYKVAQFNDDRYSKGRYGVYVRVGETPSYTYKVDELAYWVIE